MGVAKDADDAQIKRAHRKLARKYHPDVSNEANAEEKFKELQEAYEVLKDPEKRKAYDQLGSEWKSGQEFKPPPGWERAAGFDFHSGGFAGSEAGQFSDFFESLFGGQFRGRAKPRDFARRGDDLRTKIEISLEDAFKGISPTITLNVPELNQYGQLITKRKALRIKIPAGVVDGQKMRLTGQGGKGSAGASKGDLYLEIHIKPHPYFAIEGHDVYLDLPVTPWEAALGTKIGVPTLAGMVDMTLPKGVKSGKRMRLKGRGLKSKAVTGDQYVTFLIQTPVPTTNAQIELYEKMAREMSFNPRDGLF